MVNRDIYSMIAKVPENKTAFIYRDSNVSYKDLKQNIDYITNLLKMNGLNKAETVGIFVDESPNFIYCLLSVVNADAVAAPFNIKYPPLLLQNIISSIKPSMLIIHKHYLSIFKDILGEDIVCNELTNDLGIIVLSDGIKRLGHEKSIVIFTSGTTALPKGLYHKEEDFMFVGEGCFDLWDIKDDIFLSLVPLCSALTMGCALIPSICMGKTIVILPKRNPESIIEAMEKHKVSFVVGSPTSFRLVIDHIVHNKKNVKRNFCRASIGGAHISENFSENMDLLFTELLPQYGMTELLAVSTTYGNDKQGVGVPLKGIEVKVNDEGLICVNSPAVARGYISGDEMLLDDGWFITEDIGEIDNAGNIYLRGRKGEMINKGGNNIFPSEIESVISVYPHVTKCAVCGMEDTLYGQKIVAFIESKNGEMISQQKLTNFLKERIPTYKIPDEYIVVENIPIGETCKILKHKLKDMYKSSGSGLL